jgi:hypothetical protein
MTSAQTLIGVGVLVALVSLLADRLRLGGILALGGYRKLGLSSAAWRSWPASICEAGRLGRSLRASPPVALRRRAAR